MEELYKGTNARKSQTLKGGYCTCNYKKPHTYGGENQQLCMGCNKLIQPVEQEKPSESAEEILSKFIWYSSKSGINEWMNADSDSSIDFWNDMLVFSVMDH